MKLSTEYCLRELALNDCNISLIFTTKCKESRNVKYKCDFNCADKFATISDGFQAVKKLRQTIWIDPETMVFDFTPNNDSGLDIRKSAFIKTLLNLSTTNDSGDTVINYTIGGKEVCKHFYFQATGLSKKVFNRGVAFIIHQNDENHSDNEYSDYCKLTTKPIFSHICGNTCYSKNNFKSKVKQQNNGELGVISFLDLFFKGHCDVDNAPEESNVKYVRL